MDGSTLRQVCIDKNGSGFENTTALAIVIVEPRADPRTSPVRMDAESEAPVSACDDQRLEKKDPPPESWEWKGVGHYDYDDDDYGDDD